MKTQSNRVSRTSSAMMAAVVVGAALLSTPSEVSASTTTSAPGGEKAVQDITRYCMVCWRNARLHPDSWQDCTQEVFTRLLERVEITKWDALLKIDGEDRRELIRAIDAVKKRTQRARRNPGLSDEVADRRYTPDRVRNELTEELAMASNEVLSSRQQQILELSREGWAIPEIADQLQMSVERVSDEKYKAIRKLRQHLNS